jgi:tetratricopeptide (TPR) repeat protein
MAEPNQQRSGELLAARTEAFQQARTTNVLKTVLLIIVVVAVVILGARYIATRSIGPTSSQGIANGAAIRHKIIDLEKQIADLKTDMEIAKKPNLFVRAVQSVATFAISNWVLLSFVVALLTAIYVKIKFKIDYFESYRDVATKKMLSEFYRQLGDRMLITSEWEAGESAYRDSLTINPTNIKATYGIAKASVFQPLKGQKFYAPEIADAKLDYLIEHSAQRREDYAQLFFLKGINKSEQRDEEATRNWLRKAIEADPRYAAAYVTLGFSYTNTGETEKARECYRKAAEIEPHWALANNNLGSSYADTGEFAKAVEYLERANKAAATLLTQLSLGEAYRYAGRVADALFLHKIAVTNLGAEGIETERYAYGDYTWSFMPLRAGDTETSRQSVRIWTLAQKKMLAYYALAFDQGLMGEYSKANNMFNLGRGCDESGDYNQFCINRIDAILNFLKPEQSIREWFEQKKKELSAGAD